LNKRKQILSILGQPFFKSKLINGWQNTDDIINQIILQHKDNLKDAKKIKHLFCGADAESTAKNIFDFLRNEIQYKIESSKTQTTKSLKRFVSDGFGDCKHYSNFVNSILNVCGYDIIYRFTAYNNKPDFQHVYSYLPKQNIVIDAVLPEFNKQKEYSKKKDIKIMSLYKLSGVDEIGKISFSKVTKSIKTAVKDTKGAVKQVIKDIPATADKLAQGTKTISLAIPRNAFLGLVKLNVNGFATKLKKLLDAKGEFQGFEFWEKIGGNRTDLKNAVLSGANKKAILSGVNEENDSFNEIFKGYSGDVYVGAEPVTTATALASATPIIVIVLETLKKFNINSPEDIKDVANTLKSASDTFTKIVGKSPKDIIFKKDTNSGSSEAIIKPSDVQDTTNVDARKIVDTLVGQGTNLPVDVIRAEVVKNESGFDFKQYFTAKNIGIGAVVLIGGFMLLKKKK
jgi:hypothetical protein